MDQSKLSSIDTWASRLAPALLERVLTKLGFNSPPEPTRENLNSLYAAWCRSVPFDNVRKLIHVQSGDPGPLPGSTPVDYFEAWLRHGTGGTCWSGAGALHALLSTLGFAAERAVATMLVVPDLPPNHGSVVVNLEGARLVVDTSILHGEPLPIEEDAETRVEHPAWGVRCARRDGRWHIAWRPLHKVDGFECRFERVGAEAGEFPAFYEKTRDWSPFNYQVVARINRADHVTGLAFGQAVTLEADGGVTQVPVSHAERVRILVERIGLSEEIVSRLPEDRPTPPPPGSQTARAAENL